MAKTNESSSQETNALLPTVRLSPPNISIDFATIFGLVFTFALIIAAISLGQSNASFFNLPSLMIVILGTLATTAISFTGAEITRSWSVFGKAMRRRVFDPSNMAKTLIDFAVIAKKKGVLALSSYEDQMKKSHFLHKAIYMAIDGFKPKDIEMVLGQEIDMLVERHKRTATIARRASEIAPAMGLIGTLVGLVQMLADLENPETIGPAMAVALLTTFYGAILGTIVMAPLAVKLEKNSNDEALIKTMISLATLSIANQENPRRLEMLLNAELPPSQRIRYFD